MAGNSFAARSALVVGGTSYDVYRFSALSGLDVSRLPYSLKVLLENLLRHEDGVAVTAADVEAVAGWDPAAEPDQEIAFTPARVLMQDFTGVPAVVDLAAMRDAMASLGGDPQRINPLVPVDLVIDHSIQVDHFARPDAFDLNASLEFQRNRERYEFLKWGQQAFHNFSVVPPEHRHLPPGQPGVPVQGGPRPRRPRLPRHAGRHRLPHADRQRHRRRRLGRRRHRGRGGHARPGHPDADPPGGGPQGVGPAAGGRHRHRPVAHRHRAAAPPRRRRQVRRGVRPRRRGGARPRAGPPSATCPPSTARRSRSSPSTPRRCATCA